MDADRPATVPRAELTAFLVLLERVDHERILVCLDASYVVKGWARLLKRRAASKTNGDLWAQLLKPKTRGVELVKVESHSLKESFLAHNGSALEWAWEANRSADKEATARANAANHAHKSVVDWVELRACKLIHWVIPRVLFWLKVKWPASEEPNACKLTKASLFQQLTSHVVRTGHVWQSSQRNLRCTSCGLVLKYYDSLACMQEKAMRECIPKCAPSCLGSQLHTALHHTHTMPHLQGNKFSCHLCKGLLTLGGNLSKKLKEPCKVRR